MLTGVTLARSVDGGRTFINYTVPISQFDCCAKSGFFGDYNAIDAYGGRVVAAFPILTATGQQKVQAVVAVMPATDLASLETDPTQKPTMKLERAGFDNDFTTSLPIRLNEVAVRTSLARPRAPSSSTGSRPSRRSRSWTTTPSRSRTARSRRRAT